MKIKVLHFLLSLLPVFVVSKPKSDSFGIDIKKCPTLQGFSVLIAKKTHDGYRTFSNGAILNNNWILTLAKPFKFVKDIKKPKGLYAIFGHGKKLQALDHVRISKTYLDTATTVREFKQLLLLKTEIPFSLNPNGGDVFFNFYENDRKFLHCELISYSIVKDVLKKSYFKIKLTPGEKCKIKDRDVKCVNVIQPCVPHCTREDLETLHHPCTDKHNLGAVIMCDIDMVAIFTGDARGRGCGRILDLKIVKTTALMVGLANRSREWVDRTIRPKDDPDNDFNDDYILPDEKNSTETTKSTESTITKSDNTTTTKTTTPTSTTSKVTTSTTPTPTTKFTGSTKSTRSTDSSTTTTNGNLTTVTTNNQTSIKSSSRMTTLAPKSTGLPPVPLINRTRCSSGYRHDQIFGFASLLLFSRSIV